MTVFSDVVVEKPREWGTPPKPDPTLGYGCPNYFRWAADNVTDEEFLRLYGERIQAMHERTGGEPAHAFERLEKLLYPIITVPGGKPIPAVEDVAATLYELYCREVGGVAFNGDPLPGWRAFRDHPDKTKQSDAWMAVADFAIKHLA